MTLSLGQTPGLPDSLREPGGQAPLRILWRPSRACSTLNPSLGCPSAPWAVPAPLGLRSRSTPLFAHFQQTGFTLRRCLTPGSGSEQWVRGGGQAGSSGEVKCQKPVESSVSRRVLANGVALGMWGVVRVPVHRLREKTEAGSARPRLS